MGNDTGIGGGGSLPDDRSVKHGIDYVHAVASQEMVWNNPRFDGQVQTASSQLTGEINVYREPPSADGTEVYLVAFIGDQIISPHGQNRNIMSDEVLTGADRSDTDRGLGKGFFHYRTDVQVAPSAGGTEIDWVCSAPTTENKESTIQDQVVYSYTTSAGAESDGEDFKVSMGVSETTQNWHSVTDQIHDWYVVEESDAGTNTAAWIYSQTDPWDGRSNDPGNFDNWWESAYNVGGGWDDVKSPVELSKSTMQYHFIAAWRLFRPASTEPFPFTLTGSSTHHYCAVAMVQCGMTWVELMPGMKMPVPNDRASGHHTIQPEQVVLNWSKTIDLYALTKFK